MTKITSYDSTCTDTGDWTRQDGCKPFYCKPLILDLENSVEEVTVGEKNLLNTTVQVSCSGEGEDFNFGFNILTIEYTCGFK